jgi:hypothetical protein
MNRFKIVLIFTVLLYFIPVSAQTENEAKLLKEFHSITSEELMDWVQKLCSPEFNGRLTGTPEFVESAKWIAGKLSGWGIKPGGDNGNWFQWFDMPYTAVNNMGSLSLRIPQPDSTYITKSYNYPDEYFPGMNSGSGEITGEVVYVGFGITAPELNYDDYGGVDVKGKIVLVNRDAPYIDARNPAYSKWVPYCYHQFKLENAVRHGARGFLYIDGIGANPNISYDPSIIVCGIGQQALNDIFTGLKTTNEAVITRIRKTLKPASFTTGKVMTISANTTRHPEGKGCNVTGIIEGTDPVLKNEVIIIGAHFDAVGNSGKVVNGALDNASGVVDIMGAAKAMAQSGIKLKRSVMFLFIGGEENGLVGSNHYSRNPVFLKEKTVTFINIDMAGNGTGLAVNASKSSGNLLDFFAEANTRYIHRPFQKSVSEPSEFFGRPRTDNYNFSSRGFRTMSIGVTGGYKKVFYHMPGDDPDAITIDIMEDVAKMIYVALTNMANDTSLKF